jgi:two-component system, LytTR family, sensor histidine kinase AlgZ
VHPIFTSRSRTVLYLVSWIPIAALLTAILARGGAIPWSEAAVIVFPLCLLFAFICQASWYLCTAVPLRGSEVGRLCATHAAAAAFSAGAWVGLGWVWAWLLDTTEYLGGVDERYVAQLPILFVSGFLIFLLAVAFNYLLITFEASQAAEKKTLELQVLAREAELKALRAQIDPHFLFNSLNSISALAVADPATARRMCVLLADFLRGSLKLGSEERIPLSEEINLAEGYLDIERVRLGSRLKVERDIEPQCESCLVPPLIMQPLVENAITHGIAPTLDGGTVRMQAQRSGAGVKIVIENPFDAESRLRNGSGVGLKNVRMRLNNLYSGDARMDINQNDGRFRVELQLPCNRS